jgi:hypothetical protein
VPSTWRLHEKQKTDIPTIKKNTAKKASLPALGQRFIRDNDLKGFAIRLTATGARSYIWVGRIKQRPRRNRPGLCSDLTAAQAREKVKRYAPQLRKGATRAHNALPGGASLPFDDVIKV